MSKKTKIYSKEQYYTLSKGVLKRLNKEVSENEKIKKI